MNESLYRALYDEFLVGYAYHEMIYDDNQKPIDYRVLNCNQGYLTFLGRTKENVINRKITEIIPDFHEDPFDWIEFYNTVSNSQNYEEFIQHSKATKRWHKIIVFSDKKGTFTTVFFDIADVLSARTQELQTLANVTEFFFNVSSETLNPEQLCQEILDIVHAEAVLYRSVMTQELSTKKTAFVSRVQNPLKYKKLAMNLSDTMLNTPYHSKELLVHYDDFTECQVKLEDGHLHFKDELGELVVLNIMFRENFYGHFLVLMSKKRKFLHEVLMKIYIRQFGILMAQLLTDFEITKERDYYQRILQGSRLGTWEWDAHLNKLYFNQRFAEMLGYELKDISSISLENWLKFSHPEDVELIKHKLLSLEKEAKEIYSLECRKKHKQGHYVWVQDEGKVIERDCEGRILLMSGTFKNIHDTKLAQLELEKAEQSNSELLANLPGISYRCLHDAAWTMLFVSDYCQELTGYKSNELLNNRVKQYQELIHEEDLQRVRSVWDEALKAQKHATIEYRIYTNKNEIKWVWEKGRGIYDEHQNVMYLEGIILDITERKQAQQEALLEAKRFSTFVNVSHTGAWEYFVDQEFLWCSEPYFEMLGHSSSDFDLSGVSNLYDTWIQLIHPEDRERATEAFSDYLDAGSPGIYENYFRMRHINGHYIWIWSRGSSVRDEEGNPLNRVMGTHIDITKTKSLEMRLSDEKQRIETTLISVGDGVVSTDASGNIMLLNKMGETLTGYTQDEVQNKPFDEVFTIIDRVSLMPIKDVIKESLENEEGLKLKENRSLISKEGIERPIEHIAAPIYNMNGEITGVVMVFRDITEKQKEKEKILNLSYRDQLTGIYNRRFYQEELERLDVSRNLPISLIMIDVNGLKIINDSFGHLTGDECLKATAEVLKQAVRSDDILARYGGDEFIILLPSTTTQNAYKVIERIKQYSQTKKIENITLSLAYGVSTKYASEDDIYEVFKTAEDAMYQHKLHDHKTKSHETIDLIMQSLYAKSPRELAHSKRVGDLSKELAKKLSLGEIKVRQIETAGLLHDIGKIGIPEIILNKPADLTPAEWASIKRHSEVGWRILSSSKEFKEVAEMVLLHHERFDGTGYPKGLKGSDIAFEARIIAIVDAYDTMVNSRPYRKKMTKLNAVEELRRCAGTQFDPRLTTVFIEDVLQVK